MYLSYILLTFQMKIELVTTINVILTNNLDDIPNFTDFNGYQLKYFLLTKKNILLLQLLDLYDRETHS